MFKILMILSWRRNGDESNATLQLRCLKFVVKENFRFSQRSYRFCTINRIECNSCRIPQQCCPHCKCGSYTTNKVIGMFQKAKVLRARLIVNDSGVPTNTGKGSLVGLSGFIVYSSCNRNLGRGMEQCNALIRWNLLVSLCFTPPTQFREKVAKML